ncbi:polysaccharide pyruvyl transferase family protein [Priestia megaterium]|uniref:polysaccharide pyruvyl transferase family protein n=1 Tax=Priestia megaterium TaxID=1404 RepID=UPI0021AC29E7|nr:polysaccharide pyruvyl transferase family protein [Priestia megaterium]MCR8929536.1 polysaccharide pyruvyl transferase family protein [Priestia megaterium]
MRIAVDAYFNNNLGDDLFLKILVERYPNAHFDFLLCDEMACEAFKKHPRVRYVSRKKVFKNILNYQAYILIGGSMFQEPNEWKTEWRKLNLTVNWFKFFRKSTFVLGCNYGPVSSDLYDKAYCKVFNKLTHMTVRDEHSYGALVGKKINLSVYPDIVLGMEFNKKIQPDDKLVGISVIDWHKNENVESYINFNVNIIKSLLLDGKKIRLFAFQNADKISDLEICNKILRKLNLQESNQESNIEIISYKGDVDVFLEKYIECKYAITSRFHSLIISLLSNQIICPVIYSNKTLNTIKYLGIGLKSITLDNIENYNIDKVKELFEINKSMDRNLINTLSQESKQHFKILDQKLRK